MCFCSFYCSMLLCLFFFFNDTAPTEIYTLSLHDALPISRRTPSRSSSRRAGRRPPRSPDARATGDRKSTRLNSSHTVISYAVFCLKKKKKKTDRSSTNDQHRQSERKPTTTQEPLVKHS